jgi:site-specific DNA recombinase
VRKKVKKLEKKMVLEKPKRVVAYARVASGKDAMFHSLSAQVNHYSELIQVHEGWQYACVYADETLTGMNEDRADFQRLLSGCRAD